MCGSCGVHAGDAAAAVCWWWEARLSYLGSSATAVLRPVAAPVALRFGLQRRRSVRSLDRQIWPVRCCVVAACPSLSGGRALVFVLVACRGWLGSEAWWWSLCGHGAVAVQGCAGQWRCWLASVDRVGVVVLMIRAKAWPVLAGRRRRPWASLSSLEAPSR